MKSFEEISERFKFISFMLDELICRGTHCGSTHIQKTCYVAQSMLKVELGYKFIPYIYGPYCSVLSDEIGQACNSAILDHRSSYFLCDHVKEYVDIYKEDYPYKKEIGFIGEWFKREKAAEVEKLTAAYMVITEVRPNSDEKEHIEIMQKWKPHFTVDEIKTAIEVVKAKQQEATELIK